MPRTCEHNVQGGQPNPETALSRSGGQPLSVDERIPLALTADRGRLGLELSVPIELGPLTIEGLVLTFANLRFPLDLSGGVPAFRHRRGQLQRISLSLDLQRARRWVANKFRAIYRDRDRPPDLWSTDAGFAFGWSHSSSAIAAELQWAPLGEDARFVLANVRGAGGNGDTLAEVLRTIDELLGEHFIRQGRLWVCSGVAQRLSRIVLPAAGARAPACLGLCFGALVRDGDKIRTHLDVQLGQLSWPSCTVSSVEFAQLVRAADDALFLGDIELARKEYMSALEWAPKHRDLVVRVSELDLHASHREHAALGLINETMPVIAAGTVGAELLERTGDRDGAVEALNVSIRSEQYPPLRAMLHVRKAQLTADPVIQRESLDLAVAAAPTESYVRWARFEYRMKCGDFSGALMDGEHLELAASGTSAKLEVCVRCGKALLRASHHLQAAKFFERALRFCPDNGAAAAGLAESFVELGQPLRAIALLERIVADQPDSTPLFDESRLKLACLIAKDVGDLPQAIARAKQIPVGSRWSAEARACEARWRHTMGDDNGASLAWARMRECIELGATEGEAAVHLLLEAASFETDERHDFTSAERHLSMALRMESNNQRVAARYRQVLAALSVKP